MSIEEVTVYPTDILKSKYRTLLEASNICNCHISVLVDAINKGKLRYAEFKVEGKRSRIVHVNPDDVYEYLRSIEDERSNSSDRPIS